MARRSLLCLLALFQQLAGGVRADERLTSSAGWKCQNKSYGDPGDITLDGVVMFNGSLFNGTDGSGCLYCDCCYDYIDCRSCVMNRCLANLVSPDVKDHTYFQCGRPPPLDMDDPTTTWPTASTMTPDSMDFGDPWEEAEGSARPPPPPADACLMKQGVLNPCLNGSAPGIPVDTMEFNNSLCEQKCSWLKRPSRGTPPHGVQPPFPPATLSLCTSARAPNGNSECTVCAACCRDDVDCARCVAQECTPPGANFFCSGGASCQLLVQPPTAGAAGYPYPIYKDPNCTDPKTGKGVCPAADGVLRVGSYSCFGSKCLKISDYPVGLFKSPDCNSTCGQVPTPAPRPPPPPPPPPSPQLPSLVAHSLNTTDAAALCLDGTAATVFAYINPKPSTDWVILLGRVSPGLNFCISESACSAFAPVPGAPPAPPRPPDPVPLLEGPQSLNCTKNPDWCNANHAMIPMCDMALLLSDRNTTAKGCPIPGTCCAKTVMNFAGRRILAAALKRLVPLGLGQATTVLLNGVTLGGTAVVLNADFVGEQLKSLAPGLRRYKALPVDGIHPKLAQSTVDNCPYPLCSIPPLWMSDAFFRLNELSGVGEAVSDGCKQANSQNVSDCLYATESLPFVETPLFAVQEVPSVWDSQCLINGEVNPHSVLQVKCSWPGRTAPITLCDQYPDMCNSTIVRELFLPIQKQYIADTTKSGLTTRPGSGGFFFSCYNGVYFHEDKNGTGDWNHLAIDGVTMQEAIHAWWEADEPSQAAASSESKFWHQDGLWDPDGVVPTPSGVAPWYPWNPRWGPAKVPWYKSRFMTNPTCRGYPWY